MRYLVVFAFLLTGCSMIIPDHTAKSHKWKPPPSEVRIQIAPNYPNTCATEKELDGTPYADVYVFVRLVERERVPVTIMINRSSAAAFPVGNQFTLKYRAGIGAHYIEVFVGGEPARRRTLNVFACKGAK